MSGKMIWGFKGIRQRMQQLEIKKNTKSLIR
jgi:hypothetical protein